MGMIEIGQRWMTAAEPELGLGVVRARTPAAVKVWFPAARETRTYAWPGAPLQRVAFRPGETIHWEGGSGAVAAVTPCGDLLVYEVDGQSLPEAALSGHLARRGPLDRLAAGPRDSSADFELRREALFRRARHQRSPARGFVGARLELIPHQLGIAAEVTQRWRPRVLLADEVGLGKTIEACLILQRLHLTGRADRVLILVPEPLVHQWFIELLRRFNLRFSLFDEARCASIEDSPEGGNPFLDSQLLLCPLDLLALDPLRARQALAAPWDLLIVDEAHHLSETGGSAFAVVERLAEEVPGLLLLSGTPQQAGPAGHFARLRLLDPARYRHYADFCQEIQSYQALAQQVAALDHRSDPAAAAQRDELLDRCGIGRVMFRNQRSALGGFPQRQVHPAPLPDPSEATRLRWLTELLRATGSQKLLLICRTAAQTEALQEALRLLIDVKCGLFHEGLTLLQRDRQAAWFAQETGARLLLCSEIGSEGRNFQFAQHLVLFDLPADPDLLEQRIGRLDRIGQPGTIHLHIPFATGTAEEVLFRWYRDGLQSLAQPLSGAAAIAAATQSLLAQALADPSPAALDHLVAATQRARLRISAALADGHDRLLQWQTQGRRAPEALIRHIEASDRDAALESFQIRLLEALGMQVEELQPRRWMLQAGSPATESLPELPAQGLCGTFDRRDALAREDIAFLSLDHPTLRGALDLLLSSAQGSAACALLSGLPGPFLILEGCFVLECLASPDLHADRFLPSLPIRVAVDHTGADRSADPLLLNARASEADPATSRAARAALIKLDLAASAERLAAVQRDLAVAASLQKMHRVLGAEIARLDALAERWGHISREERDGLRHQQAALAQALGGARLRMDSLRVAVVR